jgi:DNA-binding NtrC family response regulator
MFQEASGVAPQPAVAVNPIQRVLVVDSDPQLRQLLVATLTRAGYKVAGAENGRTALLELARHPADLIVTEMVMKEMDGLALIEKLRENAPEVRVIAMSGASNQRLLAVADAIGAAATLVKPFNRDALTAALARCHGETP